jgi:Zn-dependent peptidase ImmA (M78 family)
MSPKQLRALGISDITPAIWYKFRGERLTAADRESVLLIRQLGHYQNEIEEVTGKRAASWKPIFETVRTQVDNQAPPGEQGRRAARIFRELTGLSQCATGIGEVFRGYLRGQGLLVVESPVPESQVEGCSFYVGAHPSERPCLFANTFHSTWFRRNVVLMHELGHAIFDAPSVAASLDFAQGGGEEGVSEQRAQAFAQEGLIPREVLNHIAQSLGINWDSVTMEDLAALVARTHVEHQMVVKCAISSGFVSESYAEELLELKISAELKRVSERALDTREYLRLKGEHEKVRLLLGKRTPTIPLRAIRLPVSYVMLVVGAAQEGTISRGKAAQLLMVNKDELESRFSELAEALDE